MAQEPTLKIDGTQVLRVLSVEYQLINGADRDGRPTRDQTFSGILIRHVADDKATLANWSKDPKESNRKSGEINFFGDASKTKPTKTLKWKNGFIHKYSLAADSSGDHVVESVLIQAEEIECGGLKLHLNWPDKA